MFRNLTSLHARILGALISRKMEKKRLAIRHVRKQQRIKPSSSLVKSNLILRPAKAPFVVVKLLTRASNRVLLRRVAFGIAIMTLNRDKVVTSLNNVPRITWNP